MNNLTKTDPFTIKNIRLFIAFRVFFNARFYYPVFTILFLDFGLTLEQFALLNAVWAATIVIMEVPSGALADAFGRRKLLVFSGMLMVVEVALLCVVPKGHPNLLFGVFLFNRVLSGTAEASASGADEAIAYDALKRAGSVEDWGRVLDRQMRAQSAAFILAMTLGGAVYDPSVMQWVTNWLGFNIAITQDITLRFPIYLTLLMAVLTLLTALRMQEVVTSENGNECADREECGISILRAFELTFQAGRWILKTPFALIIIVVGLTFDSIIRMIITLNSQYYRLIELPEASFGLIGSGMSVLGLFIPRLCLRLAERHSPSFIFAIMSVLSLLGLWGITLMIPVFGVVPILLLFSVMFFLNFFQSHYLNRIANSEQRATILSFKGLANNLSYGFLGILYSLLVALLRDRLMESQPQLKDNLLNIVFIHSLDWFPWFFLAAMVVMVLYARRQLRHSVEHKKRG
ncbi:MFS transporter [Thermodesulfobacteriota bacterium]